MSVSVEFTEPLAGWDCVHNALGEIEASVGEFERFFGGFFEQLELMSAELAAREQWLARTALPSPQPPANPSGEDQPLPQWLEEARQERAGLRTAEEAMQGQASRLAAVAAELSEFGGGWSRLCEELTTARNELQQQAQQWAAAQAAARQLVADKPFREQLGHMAQQQALLEQQRAQAEAELDVVRGRAAEMAEALAEQKRALTQQQAEWADELKRIRRLVETMPERLAGECAAADVPRAGHRGKEAPGPPAEATDPVLGSVMAQFEILQRDMARRRAGTA